MSDRIRVISKVEKWQNADFPTEIKQIGAGEEGRGMFHLHPLLNPDLHASLRGRNSVMFNQNVNALHTSAL